MQHVAEPIPDRCGVNVQPRWLGTLGVIEYRAALQVWSRSRQLLLTNHFKQRMAGSNPLQRGIFGQVLFVEDDQLVFFAELPESRLQPLAGRPEILGASADPVGVFALSRLLRKYPNLWTGVQEEVFYDLGHQSTLFRFGRLANNRREIELTLRQAFQR